MTGPSGAATPPAARWMRPLNLAFALAYALSLAVQHNDRSQPSFLLDPVTSEGHPLYHMVTHFGLTYTHAIEEWILKVEAAHRLFDPFQIAVLHGFDKAQRLAFAPRGVRVNADIHPRPDRGADVVHQFGVARRLEIAHR